MTFRYRDATGQVLNLASLNGQEMLLSMPDARAIGAHLLETGVAMEVTLEWQTEENGTYREEWVLHPLRKVGVRVQRPT